MNKTCFSFKTSTIGECWKSLATTEVETFRLGRMNTLPISSFTSVIEALESFFGKLINEESGKCLDVSGYDGEDNMQTYACKDKKDQEFCLYENGELAKEKKNQNVVLISGAMAMRKSSRSKNGK